MLDTSKIQALASDPVLKPVVADILDGLQEVPEALIEVALDHIHAARDAIHHGAWGLPPDAAAPLLHALGRTMEVASA